MPRSTFYKHRIAFADCDPAQIVFFANYFKWFDKRRAQEKIKVKILFNDAPKKLSVPHSEIRFLPQKYSSPLAVNIYSDKVALILWSKDNPFAVVVKNKEISEGYKKYFELMWHAGKK